VLGARARAGCARARRGTVAAAAGFLLPAATGQVVGGGGVDRPGARARAGTTAAATVIACHARAVHWTPLR